MSPNSGNRVADSMRQFSKNVVLAQTMAVGERLSGHTLASFELHFAQLQDRAVSTGYAKAGARQHPSRRELYEAPFNLGTPNMQQLPAKVRVRSRPWQKTAHEVVNRAGRLCPRDYPVFFLQNGRIGRLRVILLFRCDGSANKLVQSGCQQPGAHSGEALTQFGGRL